MFRRKRLLLWGLAIFVIANLGTAIAPTFGVALAMRALAGLGAAMFSPTATGAATMIVPPERRGFALSVVIAGMTVSTALGSPIGTLIGGLGDWRWTMVFVAALAAVSGFGVSLFLSNIPMPPAVTLAKRLAPLADARIGLTLATTLLFFSAAFTIYTYFAVVFGQAIGGNPTRIGRIAGAVGRRGDHFGSFYRKAHRRDRQPQGACHFPCVRHGLISRCCRRQVPICGQRSRRSFFGALAAGGRLCRSNTALSA